MRSRKMMNMKSVEGVKQVWEVVTVIRLTPSNDMARILRRSKSDNDGDQTTQGPGEYWALVRAANFNKSPPVDPNWQVRLPTPLFLRLGSSVKSVDSARVSTLVPRSLIRQVIVQEESVLSDSGPDCSAISDKVKRWGGRGSAARSMA